MNTMTLNELQENLKRKGYTSEEIDAVPSGDPGQWEISMRELCQEIEKLPASEQQTAISVKASAIYQSLGEFNRYCESFFDAAVSEKLCNFMNTHAFQPGDSEHGWEKQCSVIAPDGLRHCGGYREDHPMSVKAEGKRQKELRGETIPDDRQPAICPHCQTRWTYRDGKWNAVIKRHGRHCQCPDNWKCTICKALILNPADFAEYEKNGTHVACMEKELTGTEHFPPCEEWSHGWTNTETGVECSRCGVRRGNCPECGHDEHGAVCPSPCLCMFQIKKIARADGNYTANDSTFPTEITFQNGRKVGIAFDGDKPYLTVGIVE